MRQVESREGLGLELLGSVVELLGLGLLVLESLEARVREEFWLWPVAAGVLGLRVVESEVDREECAVV